MLKYSEENQTAIKQRWADTQLIERKLEQRTKAQNILEADIKIRRETLWFKGLHVLVGAILGAMLATIFFSIKGDSQTYAPVVHQAS